MMKNSNRQERDLTKTQLGWDMYKTLFGPSSNASATEKHQAEEVMRTRFSNLMSATAVDAVIPQ
jgi:hypothetical protein